MPLRGRSRWSLKHLLPRPPVSREGADKATLRAPLRSGLTACSAKIELGWRIDSRFLLPVRGRCLMKMLPVASLYDEAADAEATKSDDTTRADNGAARAVRRSQSKEQADNPGRVCGSVWLPPETRDSA